MWQLSSCLQTTRKFTLVFRVRACVCIGWLLEAVRLILNHSFGIYTCTIETFSLPNWWVCVSYKHATMQAYIQSIAWTSFSVNSASKICLSVWLLNKLPQNTYHIPTNLHILPRSSYHHSVIIPVRIGFESIHGAKE